MKLSDIYNKIKQETLNLSEKEEWEISESILLGELLDPEGEIFEYNKYKGFWVYEDSLKNLYFVRLSYNPTSEPFMEFKTGWFENNDLTKIKYDPNLPSNVTSMDSNKRTNTVAKIYKDEVLDLFKRQNLTKKLIINPISESRYKFAIRMVNKLTPKEFKIEETYPKQIIITKP